MERDAAVQAVSESEKKRETFAIWYRALGSSILAGFEAYGSAQIGMLPRCHAGDLAARSEERGVNTAGVAICNHPAASGEPGADLNVRSGSRRTAANAMWSPA